MNTCSYKHIDISISGPKGLEWLHPRQQIFEDFSAYLSVAKWRSKHVDLFAQRHGRINHRKKLQGSICPKRCGRIVWLIYIRNTGLSPTSLGEYGYCIPPTEIEFGMGLWPYHTNYIYIQLYIYIYIIWIDTSFLHSPTQYWVGTNWYGMENHPFGSMVFPAINLHL